MLAILISITFGGWIIPAVITLICAILFWRNASDSGTYSGGPIDLSGLVILFSALWFIPALLAWLIYFMVAYFSK